ncbi:MAG: NAD(P)/FAD-dependent oxidoreductase [Anaerovoracaceae bacterium]|jgi:thioredoxin reductase (NADPH)
MQQVIVIGGGPAGVSAAIYARRGGLAVSLFSMGTGALAQAARIENYYGFPGGISGEELMARGLEQARQLGVEVLEQEVVGLGFTDRLQVDTADGTSRPADAVVLAMGAARRRPEIRNLEKYEGSGVSYCAVCDGFFFRGKDVAVLGSGPYARHEADVLRPLAASVTCLDEEDVVGLEGGETLERVLLRDGTARDIAGLFIAMGSAGSVDLAKKLGAATADGHLAVDENRATTIPGLYAAGDCTGGLLQVAKAVDDGAHAGLAVVKALREKRENA